MIYITMSYESDRNPSPPPEILGNEDLLPDRIGDSVYSKQWLYKTLMNIMQAFTETPEVASAECDMEEENFQNNSEPVIVELDPKLEADACILWDMTANYEVSNFLYDCGVTDIFLEVIDKTKSPRLLEIVIGILANMASFDSICQNISKNKTLIYSVILLSGTSDSPTLIQVFRFISCGIANESSKNDWFSILEENPFLMENLKFILENNLNGAVLNAAFELIDKILNEYPQFCYIWGNETYAAVFVTAANELLKSQAHSNLDQFFYSLNTMFQHAPNVNIYVKYFSELQSLFHTYLLKLTSEETLPESSRIPAMSCLFATYGALLKNENMKKEFIVTDTDVLKAIRNIYLSVNKLILNRHTRKAMLSETAECSKSQELQEKSEDKNDMPTSMSKDEYNNWTMLMETIVYAVSALLSQTERESDRLILSEILEKASMEV